jgi:glycosyltransferase involved in cell wall biosynthesis
MKISVLVLTHNSEKYIKKCLDSLISNIDAGDEIIVLDNNSKDNTIKTLKEYSDKISIYLCNSNLGVAQGRNVLSNLAINDVLSFIDSDIVLCDNSLKNAKKTFHRTKCKTLIGYYKDCGEGLNWYIETLRDMYSNKRKNNGDNVISLNNFATFSGGLCLIDKETFTKYYGYDSSFFGMPSEDIHLELLMLKDNVKIILDRSFKAVHFKDKLTLKKIMKRFKNSGRAIIYLIKLSSKYKYKLPLNGYWPYFPIHTIINLLLLIGGIFCYYLFLIVLLNIILRVVLIIFKSNTTFSNTITFILVRYLTDFAMIYGMLTMLNNKNNNALNDDYEVVKYEANNK